MRGPNHTSKLTNRKTYETTGLSTKGKATLPIGQRKETNTLGDVSVRLLLLTVNGGYTPAARTTDRIAKAALPEQVVIDMAQWPSCSHRVPTRWQTIGSENA